MDFVKKDLSQANMKDIAPNQILLAINKGQEELAVTEDIIKVVNQQIQVVAGQNIYPFFYVSGSPPVNNPYIKNIISLRYPSNWIDIKYYTSQQYDDLVNRYTDDHFPFIATVRPGGGSQVALELFGTPQDPPGNFITFSAYLNHPTAPATDFYDLETPTSYDTYLRYFADQYLLPAGNEKMNYLQLAKNETDKLSGSSNYKDKFSKSPIPNW
jgi:hypothetical protein